MDEESDSTICRLCLDDVEYFDTLGDSDKSMLNDLLPKLNLNPLADYYICKSCADSLVESYEFKSSVLDNSSNSEEVAKLKTTNVDDLDDIFMEEEPMEFFLKREGISENCCFCHQAIDEATNTLLPLDVLQEMIEKCFPEWDEKYFPPDPPTCEKCSQPLENMYVFITTCLTTEEKIRDYCLANGVNNDGFIDLFDVISSDTEIKFTDEQIDSPSVDGDSSESLIKTEPMVESYGENGEPHDESDAANASLNWEDSSSLDFYEQALLLALICRRRRTRRRQRRFWVDPWGAERLKKGMFYKLYRELREDQQRFVEYFGMSKESFDELFSLIKADISGKDTVMRRCVPAEEKLALTLRYLGTGSSITGLHREFRLGVSTISSILQHVCSSIWRLMKNKYIPVPDRKRWLEIADAFEKNLNFPNCIGAIGGRNIKVGKAKNNASLVLLAVCDMSYRFTYVEVDKSDSDNLRESQLHQKFTDNTVNIPERRPLRGSRIVTPFVLVGSVAFTISKYLMRPYSGRNLEPKKKVFNYRLARASRQVDCAFAVFSNKWKIFNRPLDVSMDFAEKIVKCCCVLHNFVLEREGYDFEHTLVIEGLSEMSKYSTQGGKVANNIRDDFASYFLTEEGHVPWQANAI